MINQILFASALAITILSGLAATLIALTTDNGRAQVVASRLAHIALLGAAAIFALLGNAGTQ